MLAHRYLIALGANQRHASHGHPRRILIAALIALEQAGLQPLAVSPIVDSRPLGPSLRTYANGAVIVVSNLAPPEVLDRLQSVEAAFGRRRRGRRWGARALDLDLVLWSGGCWAAPGLTVPHPAFRERDFVLKPASVIAGNWRDPITGFTLRQLHARLTRPRTLPKPRPSPPFMRKGALSSVGRATDF